MSNYNLSSPIDVSSSGFTGQINLMSTASTNAVQLRAPTLSSNVSFVLPATSGSTGQFLTCGTSTATWSTAGNHTSLPISISFLIGSVSTAFVNGGAQRPVGTLYFAGTAVEGTPSAIYAVIGGSTSNGVQVVLLDTTNSVTIGTSAAVNTTTTPQIVQLPITGAISASAAYWSVQLKRASGGSARIWMFHVLP